MGVVCVACCGQAVAASSAALRDLREENQALRSALEAMRLALMPPELREGAHRWRACMARHDSCVCLCHSISSGLLASRRHVGPPVRPGHITAAEEDGDEGAAAGPSTATATAGPADTSVGPSASATAMDATAAARQRVDAAYFDSYRCGLGHGGLV
jgi:hypothetical protein